MCPKKYVYKVALHGREETMSASINSVWRKLGSEEPETAAGFRGRCDIDWGSAKANDWELTALKIWGRK